MARVRWTSVYWEGKDRMYNLSDMTESHICNCVRMIGKSIKEGNPWRTGFLTWAEMELQCRNEGCFDTRTLFKNAGIPDNWKDLYGCTDVI